MQFEEVAYAVSTALKDVQLPNTLQLGTATGFACGAVIPLKTPNSQSFLPLPVPAAQSDSKAPAHVRQEATLPALLPWRASRTRVSASWEVFMLACVL